MPKERSRTANTIMNFSSSMAGQALSILMQFAVRTVFIYALGESYLGISALFKNILSMLSLVELGMGNAIMYKLYKPIAESDHRTIRVIMNFYKKAYRIIGAAIALIGLVMIPLLPLLIKDYDKLAALGLNAVLIFCMYLFQSVSSYFFLAYRSSIIRADQKEYILNVVGYLFTIGSGLLQIATLLIFKKFEVYVAIGIVEVIFLNLVCAIIARRKYPYIVEKTDETLDKKEVKSLLKDCGALFLYKMNYVVVKATDNIVLSAFMGLGTVALYSNYYIFYTTIETLFAKIFNSVSHSLGNLHATDNSDHEYHVFETVMYIASILGGIVFAGIFVCSDDFIEQWIGLKWRLAQPAALLLGLELYTMSIRIALSKYRTTMGLFRQSWFRPVLGMVINIVVSVALVNVWGICGVIAGTIAADWFTFMWLDPLIVHKHGFAGKYPVHRYYLKFIRNFLVCAAVAVGDYFLCKVVLPGMGWLSVIVHALICVVTVTAAMVIVGIRSRELAELTAKAGAVLGKIRKK